MDSDAPKYSTATFAKLLQHPPKNAWNAVLTQLLSWSFRRFCVDRLTTDLSGSVDDGLALWDSHFSLITDFAPPQFKPHLDNWLAPETLTHVGNLGLMDVTFRHMVSQMDAAVAADDEATQDELATLLDEEMGDLLEKWLGTAYAPYSIFPNSEEPDDSIDMTKLNAVNYLLQRQLNITRTVRTTLLNRRMTHRASAIRAATPIKKTRRSKQNTRDVHVRFSSETRSHDSRGEGSKDDEGQRQQREGNKVSDSQEKRDDEGKAPPSEQEGNHEHPQPQVHAEPIHTPHEDTTVSDASLGNASIQQDNKEDEKERA